MRGVGFAGLLVMWVSAAILADDGSRLDGARRIEASSRPPSCDHRVNNTHKKLQECVTVESVRDHQFALQQIADAHGGVRPSGSPGYDRSVDYVASQLAAAGYRVELQEFMFPPGARWVHPLSSSSPRSPRATPRESTTG